MLLYFRKQFEQSLKKWMQITVSYYFISKIETNTFTEKLLFMDTENNS